MSKCLCGYTCNIRDDCECVSAFSKDGGDLSNNLSVNSSFAKSLFYTDHVKLNRIRSLFLLDIHTITYSLGQFVLQGRKKEDELE